MPSDNPRHLYLRTASGASSRPCSPRRSRLGMIVSVNGTEFTSTTHPSWAEEFASPGITSRLASPRKTALWKASTVGCAMKCSTRTCFSASIAHGKSSPPKATDYNTQRPHSSIGYQTPAAYAAHLNATDRPATNSKSSAGQPVAYPPLIGITSPETLVRNR